jgi:hypothetical protein
VRIVFWAADRDGCGYYRGVLPMTALANRGHAAYFGEQLPPEVLDGAVDVLVAQRTCEPGPSAAFQRIAREGRIKTVYELDDDLLSVDPSNKAAWSFYAAGVARHDEYDLSGNRTTTAYFDDGRRARIIENITMADVVTVSTDPLAEIVSQWNPNVHVLPNQIPGWLLDHTMTRGQLLTVGWRGGMSHARDFGELAAPLRRFLAVPGNRDAVELHLMGADYGDRVRSSKRFSNVRHTGWVDGVDAFLRAVDFDVAVVPLRASTFNDSKSDLALLEMSALGIPAITSDAGPYAVRHGGPNIACSTPAQWSAALVALAEDTEYRSHVGKQARAWAADRTIDKQAHLWEEAYSS